MAEPATRSASIALFRDSFRDTFGHLYRREDLAAFLDEFTPEALAGRVRDPALSPSASPKRRRRAGRLSPSSGRSKLPVEPRGTAIELRQLYVLEAIRARALRRRS